MRFGEKGPASEECKCTPKLSYDLCEPFGDLQTAIEAIVDVLVNTKRSYVRLAVARGEEGRGQIVWAEPPGVHSYSETRKAWIKQNRESAWSIYQIAQHVLRSLTDTQAGTFPSGNINAPQEVHQMDYVAQQPLHIPRESLITRLEERRNDEIKAREDRAEAARKARQEIVSKVEKLTSDQVTNVLHHFVQTAPASLHKWLDDVLENGKFVSKDEAPTSTETQLDKMISVLNLAADKEIEVAPTDPIYPLL
jgi:hypothetical protein